MEGQEELCTWSQDDHRADGLARESQAVADPALEAQGSTGCQDFKSGEEVGGRTFPNPNNEISNVNLGCQHRQVDHCQVSVSCEVWRGGGRGGR